MKIKNPIKIIKSTKEPVKTIQDLETRKKDVKQWLIISGVLCIIGIGFFGLLAFGLINFALNKIAKKFELLTCKNCGKMASFSNIEEFKKYITYNTLRYKAEYNGISHPRSNDGIVSYVEAKGSAIAIVNISLTCPHCGAVKKLRYYTTPFKCSDSQEKVNVRDVELVKSRLEKSVKQVVDIYNDSQRHHEIPYSTDSIHHPDYDHENRLKLQFKKDTYYNGVKIVCHREVEEIVEGYFLYDDLHGKMENLNENSKLKDNESKPQGNNEKDETFKLEGKSEVIQTSLDDSSEHTFLKEGQCEVVNNQNKNLNQTSNNNILENLEVLKKLKELLDLGVITQKEFEEKKILLLDIGVKKQEMQSTKQYVNTATKSQKNFRIFNFLLTILTIVTFMVGVICLFALDFRYYAGSFAPDYQQVWLYLPFIRAAFSSQNVVDVAVWCLFILIGAILMLVSLTIKLIIEIKQNNNKKIIILDIITILISAIAIIPSAIIVDWAKPGVKLFLILTSSCAIAILVHLFSLLIRNFLSILKLLNNKI